MQRLCRPARSLTKQLFRSGAHTRTLASKRGTRAAQVWPRLAFDRQENFTNDPEILVRTAHEKERLAFRYALEQKDLAGAYQIYIEQRELPILSGAEVTSLLQLISADALLRKLNSVEQPESLKDVFWTIVEDVKERKVAGQTMLWVHALDTLVTWELYDEARELWTYLEALPNRVSTDKNDAHCIDSRVYGSAVKLFTAIGEIATGQALYDQAMTVRQLNSSLMLDQAMIAASFQSGKIGEAYKLMDKAIREQRRALRPAFFNTMMALALDARAVGVATEIFMKACNVKMPPAASQVTRLLSSLGRSKKDGLGPVVTVFKHYQAVNNGELPIEHVNTVITSIFGAGKESDSISNADVLARVHQLLRDMEEIGVFPSSPTINILLAGYTEMGEHERAEDLMSRVKLNDVSFRTMLKALSRNPEVYNLDRLSNLWSAFKSHREKAGTNFVVRDLQMVMRAAFRVAPHEAAPWISNLLAVHGEQLDEKTSNKLKIEFEEHKDGRFVFGRTSQPQRVATARSMRWLEQ